MPSPNPIRLPRRERHLPAAMLISGGIVACLLACWLGIVAGRPFVLARQMRVENERIEQRNEEMKIETQELRKQAVSLRTDPGMEREARRLGYVRQGEVPLVIP